MTSSSLVALGRLQGTSRPKSFNSNRSPLTTAEPPNTCFPDSLSKRLSSGCCDLSSGAAAAGANFRPRPALVRPIRFVRIDLGMGRRVLAANETLKQTENYHARKVKGGTVSDDWPYRNLQARDLDF